MNYFLNFRQKSSFFRETVGTGNIEQIQGFPHKLGTANDLLLESKITFLIHGYNVNEAQSQKGLLAFADFLTANANQKSAYVAVSWPGNERLLNFASYPIEGKDADDTAAQFVDFIDRSISPTVELSFVSHSLGARVVLETIRRLQKKTKKNPIGQICLMAAAVDDSCLASPLYRPAVELAKRVAVLASHGDLTLGVGYLAGDFIESFIFPGQISGRALGFDGDKPYNGQNSPPQVFPIVIKGLTVNHGDYLPSPPATAKQTAAMNFTRAILEGVPSPKYA